MATLHDIGVAAQIGSYSDGVETPQGARWLYTSGTPGLAAGCLPLHLAIDVDLEIDTSVAPAAILAERLLATALPIGALTTLTLAGRGRG